MRSFVRVGAAVALASAGAVVAIGSGTAGAEPVSQEFTFTGAAQEFVVPAGVCSLTVDAFGAEGGDGAGASTEENFGVGGQGGRATATIPVAPGETLFVYVGEEGHDGAELGDVAVEEADGPDEDGTVTPAALPADSAGGFNGGGDGGSGLDVSDGGAGGGGASDVRQGGDALENRVVIAGGGAGGGGDNDDEGGTGDGNGGEGGGLEGTDGTPSNDLSDPGLGGTQTAGGAGGANDPSATDGELGLGGNGGTGEDDGGGGGGGGLFGGGGGAGAAEGDDGGGGGGGSGFGPAGTTFETGNQFGDGLVILSYDPALQTCPIAVEPRFTG